MEFMEKKQLTKEGTRLEKHLRAIANKAGVDPVVLKHIGRLRNYKAEIAADIQEIHAAGGGYAVYILCELQQHIIDAIETVESMS